MGAGTSLVGDIEFLIEDQGHNIRSLVQGLDSVRMDKAQTGAYYFNNLSKDRNLAAGDENVIMTQRFEENEKLHVDFTASALAEAIAFDTADSVQIGVIFQDLNTGKKHRATLKIGDTDITADPTSIIGTPVRYFTYTIPKRMRMWVDGLCHILVPENA